MISWCKRFLVDWWLLIFISFLLWYRNKDYDRVISIFIIMVAIINLVEYGVFSGMSETEAGKWIYITLWVQILALAISCHVYVQETITAIYLFVIALVSIIFIIYGFFSNDIFIVNSEGWFNKSSDIFLGSWWWIYVLGLIIPVLLIAYYKNPSILILIFYGILIGVYIMFVCPEPLWGSNWFLLASGIAFLTWLIAPLYNESFSYKYIL